MPAAAKMCMKNTVDLCMNDCFCNALKTVNPKSKKSIEIKSSMTICFFSIVDQKEDTRQRIPPRLIYVMWLPKFWSGEKWQKLGLKNQIIIKDCKKCRVWPREKHYWNMRCLQQSNRIWQKFWITYFTTAVITGKGSCEVLVQKNTH